MKSEYRKPDNFLHVFNINRLIRILMNLILSLYLF
jgi:hypothetical protein